MDVFIYMHSVYVSIAIRADCGCVLQYNPPFSIKYDILSKPKASSKQPESAELERKIENYGRIGILKAEYQVTRFWFNLQECVCYHVGVCVCCLDKFSYCCTSRKWGDLFLTLWYTSFFVLLARWIISISMDVFIYMHSAYVSIAMRT